MYCPIRGAEETGLVQSGEEMAFSRPNMPVYMRRSSGRERTMAFIAVHAGKVSNNIIN